MWDFIKLREVRSQWQCSLPGASESHPLPQWFLVKSSLTPGSGDHMRIFLHRGSHRPPDGRPVQEGGEPVYLDNRGDPADTEGDLQEVTALR